MPVQWNRTARRQGIPLIYADCYHYRLCIGYHAYTQGDFAADSPGLLHLVGTPSVARVIFADWSLTLFGHEANASIWFLALIGFPNALIYAGIWLLSIRGLGRFTKTGSSLLIMGLMETPFYRLYMERSPMLTA